MTASYWRGVANGVVGGVTGTARLVGGLATHPVDTVSAVGSDLSMRAQTMYELVRHPIQAKEAITDAIMELGPNRSMEILGDAGGNVIAVKGMSEVAGLARTGIASRFAGAGKVPAATAAIQEWLGPGWKMIRSRGGEPIFISANGLRKIRVDFKHTSPHNNPHLHV